MSSPLALIVDDDAETRDALAELARLEGFETVTAGSVAEAREHLQGPTPAVVLTDLILPDGTGMDLFAGQPEAPRPEVILITGNATVDSAVAALRTGVLDYLTKPVDVPRLKAVLANVSRTRAYKQEISSLRGELRKLGRFGGMIGASPAIQRVYDMIARVAPTTATVFVTGESGTGKELVAETVHELSPRRLGPFVPVNCSAVPATLIESALFGHERGSFTGASQQHRGFFERANAGTLFLDEITEMPADLQAKLLRVIETGAVVRLGAEKPIRVDVRIVAATNRSPEAAIREEKLREDLYYRLNVFPISLPPLRDRGDDVELLADYFLDALNQAEGTAKQLAHRTRDHLRRRAWPGNVRELKNALQRAFIMSEQEIELDAGTGARVPEPAGDLSALEGVRVGLTMDEMERRMIMATLADCAGDKRRAAETLGISLKTLYNRLNLYAAGARTEGV
ncbi:MAG: sigma-54 dependent transcriptional regulator [Candidatus Eisenbacteria bacterium]